MLFQLQSKQEILLHLKKKKKRYQNRKSTLTNKLGWPLTKDGKIMPYLIFFKKIKFEN